MAAAPVGLVVDTPGDEQTQHRAAGQPARQGGQCDSKGQQPGSVAGTGEEPGSGIRRRHFSARSPCAAARSEEHTSELQSLIRISYAVFCLKTKTATHNKAHPIILTP